MITFISSIEACIDGKSLFFNKVIFASVLNKPLCALFAIFSVPGKTGEATINVSSFLNFNKSSPPSKISQIS